MKYRPDVDGLRAIAVISVLMYHAHLGFSGGYVGVDVFFVISGFLITSILHKKLQDGTFSYIDFWKRRVRRLVPAAFVTALVTALGSYMILLPSHLVDLGGALAAQPLMLVNIYFWRVVKEGYFGDLPETRPLLHTWSLGVEEQFYLLLPLLLAVCWKNPRLRPHLAKALGLVVLLSFGLSVVLTPVKPVFSFFNLPTRAWELLTGGLLGFLPEAPRRPREALAWLGVAMIVYSTFFFNKATAFPGAAALVPCFGAALLIWVNGAKNQTSVGKMLANPYMVKIGLASYSLYLWHWPLMAWGEYTGLMESTESKVLLVLLSFWLGFLSLKFIETPFRSASLLRTSRSVLLLYLCYVAACGSIGGALRMAGGFRNNWDQKVLATFEGTQHRAFVFEQDPLSGQTGQQIGRSDSGGKVDFILWGDSHAMALAALLDSLGKEFGKTGLQLTASASKSTLGFYKDAKISSEDKAARTAWKEEILREARASSARQVFICGRWSVYQTATLERDMSDTIKSLEEDGVSVVVVLDNPELLRVRQPFLPEALIRRWPFLQGILTETRLVDQSTYRGLNGPFKEFISGFSGIKLIDVGSAVYRWGPLVIDDKPLYYDNDHLSDYGVLQLRPLFEPLFRDQSSDNLPATTTP